MTLVTKTTASRGLQNYGPCIDFQVKNCQPGTQPYSSIFSLFSLGGGGTIAHVLEAAKKKVLSHPLKINHMDTGKITLFHPAE